MAYENLFKDQNTEVISMKTHTHVKDIYCLEDVINKQENNRKFKTLLDRARLRVAIAEQRR